MKDIYLPVKNKILPIESYLQIKKNKYLSFFLHFDVCSRPIKRQLEPLNCRKDGM